MLAVERDEIAIKTNEKLMREYDEQTTIFGRSVGELVKSVASHFLGWHYLSAGLSDSTFCERYLSCSISANVGIVQDIPSQVLEIVLTLMTGSISFHCIRSHWRMLVFTNGHLLSKILRRWSCRWRTFRVKSEQ